MYEQLAQVLEEPSEWGLSDERLPDSDYMMNMLATLDPENQIFKLLPGTREVEEVKQPRRQILKE